MTSSPSPNSPTANSAPVSSPPTGSPPPGSPSRRSAWRWLKWLLLFLLVLVLLAVGAVALLFFNERAGRTVLQSLPRWLPQLELQDVSGTLADGLSIGQLRWHSDTLRIELKNIESRWQLGCLRRSSFCLDHLRAEQAHIWTAPAEEDPAPAAEEPFSGVDLPDLNVPWQFNIDQLSVEQLTWQSGDAEPLNMGHVSLRGVVAGSDVALHEVIWRFDDPTLGQGDLELAGHVSTASHYPMQAELQGRYVPADVEIPFERWQLRLSGDLSELSVELHAAGQGVAQLNGEIDVTQAELPLRATLRSLEPIQWQDILVQAAELKLAGSLEGYDLAADTDIQLPDQPLMNLSLRGKGDLETLAVERLRARAEESVVSVSGQLGWSEGVRWQGGVKLQRVNPGHWLADWPGRLNGQAETEFTLQDSQWALLLNGLDISGTLREWPLALSGNVQRTLDDQLTVDQVRLQLGDNRLVANGRVAETWNLSGELDLPNLAAFAPDLEGSLSGQWQVQGQREDPRLHINASSPLLAFGESRLETIELITNLAPLTLNNVDVRLTAAQGQVAGEQLNQLSLIAEGDAEDHRVRLNAGYQDYEISAAAEGAFDQQAKNWQGTLQDFALGRAATDDQQSWRMVQRQPAPLNWTNESQQLDLQSLCLTDSASSLCAELSFNGQAERLEAAADIEGFSLDRIRPFLQPFAQVDGRLTTKGRVRLEKGEIRQAEIQGNMQELAVVRVGEKELASTFRMPLMNWQMDLQKDALTADFSYRRSDSEQGRVVGSVSGLSKDPQLDLELDLSQLMLAEVAEMAGTELAVAGTAGADLRIQGSLKNPQIHGRLEARNVALGGSEVEQPWLKDLNLTGDFQGSNAELDLRLTAPGHLEWTPVSPARLSWEGRDRFSFDPSCWIAEDSRLCMEADWQAQHSLQAQVDLNTEAASALAPLLPEGMALDGAVRVQARLAQEPGETAQLTVEAALEDGEVNLSQDSGPALTLPFDAVSLNAELADQRVVGQLQLVSEALGQGNASFDIPTDATAPAQAQWDIQGIEIALLRPFLPQLSELGGKLGVSGTLAGTVEQPQIDGRVVLEDAHFNSPTLPVFMDDLDVEVRAVNNRLTIDGAFTSGDGKGRLTGDGVIDEDWQVNVRLQGDNIPVVQAPEIDLVVQPDLNLKVQVGEIFLGGKLEVTRGLLELKPLPPSAVQVSPDVVFIDERDELLETDMPWLFRTNLTVSITERVQLRGFGAQARMKGAVTVIQDERDVLIGRGTINITEGRYERFGQRLKIRSGQIIFNGPLERPFINIEAVRETETVIAGIRLTGSIEEPTVSLFSEPSLPDDTIMYYLITGNAPGSGVGDDQAMANRALLGIGLYGGTPLAEGVAEKFGVEEFDVTTSGQGDTTAVNVSGYLSPRLFVQYGIGVFSPMNTLTLRYRLRPSLFVEAVTGVENILDLLYTFEF